MKNKIFKFAFIIFFLIVPLSSSGQEQFNFDVTELKYLKMEINLLEPKEVRSHLTME